MLKRLYIAIAIVALLGLAKAWHAARPSHASPTAAVSEDGVTDDLGTTGVPSRDVAAVRPPVSPVDKTVGTSPAAGNTRDPFAGRPHLHPTRDSHEPPPAPLARYSHLRLTPKLSINEHPYRVLGARAVRPDLYRSSLGPVLFEENGYRIFEDRGEGWDQLQTSNDGRPLMVNPSNGRLVVVTGTIKVKIADRARAEQLALAENLTVLEFDSSIRIAYLKAPAGYQLLPALQRIGARVGVELVELEAVEARVVSR